MALPSKISVTRSKANCKWVVCLMSLVFGTVNPGTVMVLKWILRVRETRRGGGGEDCLELLLFKGRENKINVRKNDVSVCCYCRGQ